MTATLPEAARTLVDGKDMAVVATVQPDGAPQLSVVWVTRDGDDLLFSTVHGRRKTDNIARDPRVSVLIYPEDNPYSYLEVRGTATLVEDVPGALIQELSRKYLGRPYDEAPDSGRVIVRITPDRVVVRD